MKKSILLKIKAGASDLMSYSARRKAKRSVARDEKALKFIKSSRALGYKVKKEGKEIIAYPRKK